MLEREGDHTDVNKRQGDLEVTVRQTPHKRFSPVGKKDLLMKAADPKQVRRLNRVGCMLLFHVACEINCRLTALISTNTFSANDRLQGDLFFCEEVTDMLGKRHIVVGDIVKEFIEWWIFGIEQGRPDSKQRVSSPSSALPDSF